MIAPVLALLLQASAPTEFVRARHAVQAAMDAVDGDSVRQVRARWARAPRAPTTELQLATIERLTFDYPASDARFQRLLAAGSAPSVATYARLGLGLSHAARWNFGLAIPELSAAATQARSANDRPAEVEALLALTRLLGRRGAPDSARRLLARVEELIPTEDNGVNALAYCLRGAALRQASVARADSVLARGLALAAGHRRSHAICTFLSAQVEELRGKAALGNARAGEAVDSMRRVHDLEWVATAQQFRAYLGTNALNFDEVRRLVREARSAGETSGNVVASAWAGLNLAQVALRLGDTQEAARAASASRQQLGVLGDLTGVAAALFVIGDAYLLSGRYAQADSVLAAADSLNLRVGATGVRPSVLYRRAVVARSTGRLADATRWLDSVAAIATKIGSMGWLHVDIPYERAMLAMARGDNAAAVRGLDDFRRAAGVDNERYQYDALMRTAEAHARSGDLDAALRVARSAFALEGHLDDLLSDRDARVAVLSGRRFDFDPDLGIATVVNRLAKGGRPGDALQLVERRRARTLRAQAVRRLALAADTVGAARAAARAAARDSISLGALQRGLPDSTMALSFVTGRGGEPSTLLVVEPDTVWWSAVPSGDSLARLIDPLLTSLEGGGTGGSLADRLGEMLLGEVARRARPRATRLVVVPDGPLHRLPLDALRLPGGRAVVERFEVTIVPSLAVATEWWSAPRAPRAARVVAFGDALFDPRTGLARLPASRAEARNVVRGLPGGTAYLGANASEATLASLNLRTTSILHVASHASVEDWGVLNSAFYLTPGGGQDGRVGAEEIAALDMDTDLVVLSGCRTLGGVVVNGEGLQGLAAPFLEAGARAVAATYWDVPDRAMAAFIDFFYHELRRGARVSEAARQARLTARRAGMSPSVWSALAVFGDGDVRPLGAASAR